MQRVASPTTPRPSRPAVSGSEPGASASADYVDSLAAATPGRGPLSRRVAWVVFAAALAANLFFVTYNFRSGFLIGHEFRQAQTALIADWIDRQDYFGLRYDTPIFGAPWSAPLEYPLYEWLVVLLKRTTGCRDFEAARAISITAFYLLLPALWRLLARAGMPRERRALTLALVLSTPVYLFYSRTFLVEATVLCCAGWFLAAFVEAHATRRWTWGALAITTGTAAGLIKGLTWAAWVTPAGLYTLSVLWQRRRDFAAWSSALGWSIAMVAPAVVAAIAWTRFADAVKLENPATHFLTSRALSVGNYGLLSLGARFAPGTWVEMAGAWGPSLMPWWALLGCVAGGLVVAGRHRRAMAVALGLFLIPQLAIPYAYARQDYYFYACSVFLLAALGFGVAGLLEKPWPRVVRLGLLAVPFVALWSTYLGPAGYWRAHRIASPGGSGLADALRQLTPENSVIVIAGSDWNATLPYYAQRRAYMMPNGVDRDLALVGRQLDALADETISALVLTGYTRGDQNLVDFMAAHTELDPRPAFTFVWGDVFLNRHLRAAAVAAVASKQKWFHGLEAVPAATEAPLSTPEEQTITAEQAAREFRGVTPAPIRYSAKYGLTFPGTPDAPQIGAHPETKLWIVPPAGAHVIHWEFGVNGGELHHPDGATDGVDFVISGAMPHGSKRVLFRRSLQPAERIADRERQRVEIPYAPRPGEVLIFETQRRATYAYDWAYWGRIEVR